MLIVFIVGFLFVESLNDKSKDSQEEKKISQVLVNTVLEVKAPKEKEEAKPEPKEQKPVQEEVKAEPKEQKLAQEEVKAEPKEQKPAQEEVKEFDKSTDLGINYLSLVLYIFGFILVISVGAYIYLRQRNSSSLSNVTDNAREFKEELKSEPQEEEPAEEEVKSEPQEEKPTEEEVKSETEEKPTEEEVKSETQEEKPTEEEVKSETQEEKPTEEEIKPDEEEIKDLKTDDELDEDEKNKK